MRYLFVLFLFASSGFAQNPLSAAFPTAVATDTNLGVVCNSARGTLTADMPSSLTALTISMSAPDVAKFCAPSYVAIGGETMKICTKGTTTLTVCSGGRQVHAVAGPLAPHLAGAAVSGYIDENQFNQAFAEIKAVQTLIGASGANVHTTGKDVTFSPTNTYDIGTNGATPRDLVLGRDLYLSGKAVLGGFIVQGSYTFTSGTSITLSNNNNGTNWVTTADTDVTVTIPSGLSFHTASFLQSGTGKIIFSAAGGVTLLNPHSFTSTAGQGSPAVLQCFQLNRWSLAGDLQ